MKVRIIKASEPSHWYAKHIGEVFDVNDAVTEENGVYVKHKTGLYRVKKIDCEVIPDLVPFTFAAWDKDRSQKVFTRDGREVKQLTYFENSDYSFAGVINGELDAFTKGGFVYKSERLSSRDLFLEHTEKEYWVNVYKNADGEVSNGVVCETTEEARINRIGNKDFLKTISFKA